MVISHSGPKMKMISMRKQDNHGLAQLMKLIQNQMHNNIVAIISTLKLIAMLKTTITIQEISRQDKNLSGPMETELVQRNLMPMVTLKLIVPVRQISIRKQDNLGLIQIINLVLNQLVTQWVSPSLTRLPQLKKPKSNKKLNSLPPRM